MRLVPREHLVCGSQVHRCQVPPTLSGEQDRGPEDHVGMQEVLQMDRPITRQLRQPTGNRPANGMWIGRRHGGSLHPTRGESGIGPTSVCAADYRQG
ncbi:uncharacterized protein METZ01_LOCUS143441 [marine metagenome]|uniref:Uncharacterized protein n=1 Tax=marine metagenome TaxID=408172 RepID=A0A381ZPD0_9ZZZZ